MVEPLGAVSHVTVLLGAVRLLASVLHAASFRAKAGCHFGLRACCLALLLVLQRRYSTRKYRASLSRIGLPPLHQLASESECSTRCNCDVNAKRLERAVRCCTCTLSTHCFRERTRHTAAAAPSPRDGLLRMRGLQRDPEALKGRAAFVPMQLLGHNMRRLRRDVSRRLLFAARDVHEPGGALRG